MEDIIRELESEVVNIRTIIEHVKRPRKLYAVQYAATGDIEGVWTNIDTILKNYKKLGYAPREKEEKSFLFPEGMSYVDIGRNNFYKIQEVPIDKIFEG